MSSKAYSYIRFSSPEQAKGDSYRRQRKAAEDYCSRHEIELASSREYTFLDKGRSAYKGRHLDDEGQLRRFLDLVESGAIGRGSYLLVESLDRLSREKVSTALPRFMDLLNSGIRVVTLSDNRLYTEDYNELDLIISIVHMSRAHNESSIKAQRLSSAWDNKKALARTQLKPLGRACPAWLELVDGKYQPIQQRVETIRLIFELAIAGYGQGVIPRMLNGRDTPVFGSRNRNHSGAWGTSSVSKILGNRALLGEYQPTHIINGTRTSDGEPVTGFFPAVISEDVFYQAQAVRAERRIHRTGGQTKRFNVVQGLVNCSMCGDAMHLVNKGRPPKGATYIQCHSARKGVCKNGYIRIERIETVLREILAKVDSLSLVQSSEGEARQQLITVTGKLEAVTQRQTQMSEDYFASPSTNVATMIARLETEQFTLHEEQKRLMETLATSQVVSKEDFFEKLDLVSFEGRHAANSLLKRLGVTISVLSEESTEQWYMVKTEARALFAIFHRSDEIAIRSIDSRILDLQSLHGEIGAEDRARFETVAERAREEVEKILSKILPTGS
ncbi:recombinase family protein [Pseudomonas kulmbachensis]|uniref:recombinase family protein n=1 Tax=Pseudomonas kulmbachensis TaxID=3043408 RepID=UPI002AB16772|nr:recombinase family protein [Pseudomonas sp. V3/3/4/13]